MTTLLMELLQLGTIIIGSGIIWMIFFGIVIGACELAEKMLTKRRTNDVR